jgi:hypothetical protein
MANNKQQAITRGLHPVVSTFTPFLKKVNQTRPELV